MGGCLRWGGEAAQAEAAGKIIDWAVGGGGEGMPDGSGSACPQLLWQGKCKGEGVVSFIHMRMGPGSTAARGASIVCRAEDSVFCKRTAARRIVFFLRMEGT